MLVSIHLWPVHGFAFLFSSDQILLLFRGYTGYMPMSSFQWHHSKRNSYLARCKWVESGSDWCKSAWVCERMWSLTSLRQSCCRFGCFQGFWSMQGLGISETSDMSKGLIARLELPHGNYCYQLEKGSTTRHDVKLAAPPWSFKRCSVWLGHRVRFWEMWELVGWRLIMILAPGIVHQEIFQGFWVPEIITVKRKLNKAELSMTPRSIEYWKIIDFTYVICKTFRADRRYSAASHVARHW